MDFPTIKLPLKRYTKISDWTCLEDENGEYVKYNKSFIKLTEYVGLDFNKTGIYPSKREKINSYKLIVKKLTELNDLSGLVNIHLREWRKYDLDHKISVSYGFKNNIPPENIAHISNLRIISHQENIIKGVNIFIDEHNKWILSLKDAKY